MAAINFSHKEASTLADRMSAVASKHKNDMIANMYARVASKLENYGAPFAQKLTSTDALAIKTFLANYSK